MATERRLINLDKIKPMDFPSYEMDGLDVVRYLNTLPTVDAVEVVRCIDCAYATPDGYVCFGNGEMMPPHPTYPDRHCSCGKRRANG